MSVQKGPILRIPEGGDITESYTGIQGQITRLNKAKTDLQTAITNKGINVPDYAAIDTMHSYVDRIEQLDTSDATAAAKDIMKDKTAYVNGAKITGTKEVKLQTKTIAPATYDKNAYPDDGYDGLSKVTVSAIPTVLQGTPVITVSEDGLITAKATQNPGYVNSGSKSSTQQLTTQAAKTVTPTTASQTAVAKGVYTTGEVTVAGVPTESKAVDLDMSSGDQTVSSTSGKFMTSVTVNKPSTLIPGNIKSGVTIGGVTGTYAGSGGGSSSGSAGYKIDATNNSDGTQNFAITDANMQEKSVTITSNGTTTIEPDSGFDGMSKVDVNVNAGIETWVLNTKLVGLDENKEFIIKYKCEYSDGSPFDAMEIQSAETALYYTGINKNAQAYAQGSWSDPKYRRIIFETPPTGDLLTWLQANGEKQEPGIALQTSKSVTITSNGTIKIAPDAPYNALNECNLTVNVSSGGGGGGSGGECTLTITCGNDSSVSIWYFDSTNQWHDKESLSGGSSHTVKFPIGSPIFFMDSYGAPPSNLVNVVNNDITAKMGSMSSYSSYETSILYTTSSTASFYVPGYG